MRPRILVVAGPLAAAACTGASWTAAAVATSPSCPLVTVWDTMASEDQAGGGDRDGEQFHIGGNAGGTWWARRLDAPKDRSWDLAIQYSTKRDAAGWEGQFVIPFKELGVPTPKPGDVWRANFLTNRRTPQPRLDAWAYWTKWR